MIMTKEEGFLKAQESFLDLVALVEKAQKTGPRIDELERDLLRGLWRLGLILLQGYVASQGDGDVGETVPVPNRATPLQRLPNKHGRRYVSIFGEIPCDRWVYGTREGQRIEHVPLDARLGLPEGDFSYVLEDWAQRLCVKEAFAESASVLESLLGISLSVRSLEAMSQRVSAEAEMFRATQAPPPAVEEGELLVGTSDCKGVPMCRPATAPKMGLRRKKGEKANKKQMACVGAVYSIAPFVRTADDILDEVLRHERAGQRPQPQHKRLWAELTRQRAGVERNAKDAVFAAMSDDLIRRNRGVHRPVIYLSDGERALWEKQWEYFPWAIGILDLFHVLERLWLAAHCLHREGSTAAEMFVSQRLRALLEGKVTTVITGLRSLARGQPSGKRRTLTQVANYYDHNREHMHYDEYLAKGYPIGSGVAEGACRHLVKDRMEQTGMHWKIPGAQAMLDLRAIYLNGDWDNFMAHRIAKEQETLYQMAV
jgi:hypothetical protein